jgi:ABC-type glycerol-3-phosphate transport system substrate-binding protein
MKNISITQGILFSLAAIAIIVAVFMFSGLRPRSGDNNFSQVVIWGTMSDETFKAFFTRESSQDPLNFSHVLYEQKDPQTMEEEFVQALAEGGGPDLILLRENQILENKDRLTRIPFESYDLRDFQETFIEEANMLVLDDGYVGLPFSIDPMVLYYNKDFLNSNGIARSPQTWTELLAITPTLTQRDTSFNVSKSSIGLGDFDNVKHSKEILWAMIMQSGNAVVAKDDSENALPNTFESILSDKLQYSSPPAHSAVNFFTQFSNPNKTIYSWNRSLPQTDDFFVGGNSTFYIGFASELPVLKERNPNLNFDVAEFPQSKNATKKTTYGKMIFVALSRGAKDMNSAYGTMLMMTNARTQEKLSNLTGLPEVRRDLLVQSDSDNSFDPIFKRSALFSYGVLEPRVSSTDSILREMIEAVVSGALSITKAVARASDKFDIELKK